MTDKQKQTIGRYELLESIGRGAQGAVYRAHDPVLDRPVAIKILTGSSTELSAVAEDGTPLEARISGKLKHPNIVPIFDAGHCPIGPYLVFEFVEGQPLSAVLKANGAFTIEAAVPLMDGILRALALAHSLQILHLDLNPRNVLIDADNVPRVMDFGLSQYLNVAATNREAATGTLRYMAPEHFDGSQLAMCTDVFALGSTFYELVTGFRAMQGLALEEIRARIISADVNFEPFKKMSHGDAFATFLAGALEQSRDGRYTDCGGMLEAFELFVDSAGLTKGADAGGSHSTIDFLLRRISRTGDFPTISRTLSDINRLTGDDSDASADKLANVILRDFALTGKLLKLVNSAFYGSRAAEITKISDAVVFLGIEKVRMTANSLSFFGHMKGDSAELKDSMTKSFLSGLLARHLAQREKLPGAEEAFICGMCQNLGENLVIFYFPDEFADIAALQAEKALDKTAAARGVLGVSYAELGAAVAKVWNLPKSIIQSIRGLPHGKPAGSESEEEKLRDFAVFANELCNVFQNTDPEEIDASVDQLLARFTNCVSIDADYCFKLVNAGFERLKQYAPIFEINVAKSRYCQSVQHWLDEPEELDEAATAG